MEKGQCAKGQRSTLPCHYVPVINSEASKNSKIKAEFPDHCEGIPVKVEGWTYFS